MDHLPRLGRGPLLVLTVVVDRDHQIDYLMSVAAQRGWRNRGVGLRECRNHPLGQIADEVVELRGIPHRRLPLQKSSLDGVQVQIDQTKFVVHSYW